MRTKGILGASLEKVALRWGFAGRIDFEQLEMLHFIIFQFRSGLVSA